MLGKGWRDGGLLSENVSHSRLRPLSHEGKGLTESFRLGYAFLASGPLAEAETVFELRLLLTFMLFRIVRPLNNSSYQVKHSRAFSTAARS
jgi:hypothetical protein